MKKRKKGIIITATYRRPNKYSYPPFRVYRYLWQNLPAAYISYGTVNGPGGIANAFIQKCGRDERDRGPWIRTFKGCFRVSRKEKGDIHTHKAVRRWRKCVCQEPFSVYRGYMRTYRPSDAFSLASAKIHRQIQIDRLILFSSFSFPSTNSLGRSLSLLSLQTHSCCKL